MCNGLSNMRAYLSKKQQESEPNISKTVIRYLLFIKLNKPNYRNIKKYELYEELDKRKILPL